MPSISSIGKKCFIAVSFFLLAFPLFVHAEDDVEKMDVIGSHIKRTDVEGPSPVLVIDREQIEMSGRHSVADVLRDLPSASLGGDDNSALSLFSPTYTSLRGMDISNILTLLNGRRMATADLKMIPASAVERIEILKDGASAVYGADAVGGVINIVTKRGNTGGQVNFNGSLTPRVEGNSFDALISYVDFPNWNSEENSWAGKGDKFTLDASYGDVSGNTSYLLGGQIRWNHALYYRDREFGEVQLKDYSVHAYPGNYITPDGLKPFPNCAKENQKKPEDGGSCGFNFASYMQVKPQTLQGSAFLQSDTDLNSGTRWSNSLLYAYTRIYSVLAPGADRFEEKTDFNTGKSVDYRLPAKTAAAIGLPVIGEEPVTVYLRSVVFGPREQLLQDHFYQLQTSFNQDLADTMEAELNFNLSGIHRESVGFAGYSQIDKFQQNAEKLISATSYIKEADEKLKEEILYEPVNTLDSMVLSLEPKLTGELGEISGQPLSFALGGMGAWSFFNQDVDDITKEGKQFGGGPPSVVDGDRFYGALYGELSALFGSMAELNVALRSDYYSDFGFPDQKIPFTDNTVLPVTPSVKFSIQPVKQLKLRASWGKGFKAPALSAMHTKATVTHLEAQDKVMQCETGLCPKQQHTVHLLGNEDLEPEYSQNFNLGLVLEPVDRLSFSLDLFQVNLTNIVSKWSSTAEANASLQAILNYEKNKGASATKENLGAEIIRHSAGGPIKQVNVKLQNGEDYTVRGFDLEANAVVPLYNTWDFGLSFMHTHLIYIKKYNHLLEKTSCPVPYYSWLNDWIGGDESCNSVREDTSLQTWHGYPRWRNQLVLALINKNKDYNIQLVVSNIPGQLQKTNDPSGFKDEKTGAVDDKKKEKAEAETDYYWQVDLVGSFAVSRNSKIIAGIENVFAAKPPLNMNSFSTNSGYTNSTLYPLEGRTINLRYTYNF